MPLNSFLEKSIFDMKITIPRVHPVKISSQSGNCITTDIMWKHTDNAEKWPSLKNRGGPYYIARTKFTAKALCRDHRGNG